MKPLLGFVKWQQIIMVINVQKSVENMQKSVENMQKISRKHAKISRKHAIYSENQKTLETEVYFK